MNCEDVKPNIRLRWISAESFVQQDEIPDVDPHQRPEVVDGCPLLWPLRTLVWKSVILFFLPPITIILYLFPFNYFQFCLLHLLWFTPFRDIHEVNLLISFDSLYFPKISYKGMVTILVKKLFSGFNGYNASVRHL